MKYLLNIILILTIAVTFFSCSEKGKTADTILINGEIVTLDSNNTKAEAVAIINDKILSVGSNEKILKFKDEKTKVIDLKGKFVCPAFIESHAHFLGLGKSLLILDLTKAKNWDEIVYLVSEAADKAKPGEWILGRGWHQEKWEPIPEPNINGFPYHDNLSKASPFNPVILTHASGHAIFVNKKAMDLAGITDSTKAPEGGEIIRNNTGKAIGVFKENAEQLIQNVYAEWLAKKSAKEKRELLLAEIRAAENECLKYGITTFQDAGSKFDEIDLYKELIDSNKLNIRLYLMINENNKSILAKGKNYRIIEYGNYLLTVRSIKRYIDGALGSRSALMREDYSDKPGERGIQVTQISELNEIADFALENNFQLCIHAIGDKANNLILNLYEKKFKTKNNSKLLRWRIEHAQHLLPADISRFAELGVIPSMQPIHCTSDAPYVTKRLGSKRAKSGAYVWRRLLDAGSQIPIGTDAPVESVNVFSNFYAAVTRKTASGKEFYPENKMTRMEALLGYTLYGAKAAFEEKIKGSIEKGKLADLVVLSNNLLTVPESEIKNTKVIYTFLGGKIKYQTNIN